LDDQSLKILGKSLFRVGRLQMTGNYFTAKGFHDLTRGWREKDELNLRSLDLSDSNLNDDAREKLVPLLHSLEELILADNFLTWYGVRKMTQPQRKTKRLRRLDVSRCRLNEHAFYELIPLLLRTGEVILYAQGLLETPILSERVVLEGNELTPLELKIFARQVREAERPKLDTLVMNHCALDDECLAELAKFAFRIPHLHLQGNTFTAAGVQTLARYSMRMLQHQQQQHQQPPSPSKKQPQPQRRKANLPPPSNDDGSPLKTSTVGPNNPQWRLRSLDMKACKLDSGALAELADLAPHLTTVNLSYNSFSASDGVREFAARLSDGGSLPPDGKVLTFVDLKNCKLTEGSKRMLSEVGRREKIDMKLY